MGVMTQPKKKGPAQNADLFDYDDPFMEKTDQAVNSNQNTVTQSIDFDI